MIDHPAQTRQVAYEKIKQRVVKFQALSTRERNGLNEQETRIGYILPMFHALGWDTSDTAQMRAEQNIKGKRVDFSFVINGKPRFLLETKAISEDLNRPEYIKQARDYAWNKGVTWAVLSDFEGTRVFNAEWKAADPLHAQVLSFSAQDYLNRFDDLWLLSREAMTEGLLDARAERDYKKTPRTAITESLFTQLVDARKILYKDFSEFNKSLFSAPRLVDDAVQRMLDRLIFLRTAEDRGIEPDSLRSVLRAAPTGQVSKALAQHFRKMGAVFNSQLFASYGTDDFYATDDTLEKVIEGLYLTPSRDAEYNFAAIDADVLGRVYEQYLGEGVTEHAKSETKKKKRKSQGIYYTPTFVVRYIVQQTLGRYLEENGYNPSKPVRVLDPASGSGSFLIEAFDVLDRYLAKQEGGKAAEHEIHAAMRQRRILEENLYGVDKDEQAVEVARLNLMLKALHDRDKLPMLKHMARGDSLISGTDGELEKYFGKGWEDKHAFNWAERFPEVMREGGFDVVVGNPPYVRIQTLPKDEVAFYRDNYSTAKGNYDIYILFVERALQLLKEGGVFGMILPNKFMQVDYGEALRKLLAENKYVNQIVDFRHYQVFENATTYTCLLFLKKNQNKVFGLMSAPSAKNIEPANIFKSSVREIETSKLDYSVWSLSDSSTRDTIEKLESQGVKLIELPSDIARGSSSGADDVFVLTRSGPGLKTRAGTTAEVEQELLRMPLYATNFGRYNLKPAGKERIIFPYRVLDGGYELFGEKELKKNFPKGYKYLTSRRAELELRKDYKEWYAFSAPRSLQVHDHAEMVVPLLANRGSFAKLSGENQQFCLMASGGFSITLEETPFSPNYVLGLLNSQLLFWHLKKISSVFRGGWVTCTKQYIGRSPIRRLDLSIATEKKKHDHIVAMVERMLKLHKDLQATNQLDAERRAELQDEIARTDEQIDEAVFDLYELTVQERAVVKNSG